MNRYEQVDAAPFAYDLRGNTLLDGTNPYTYDLLNRQIGMTGPGGTAEYIHDALGRRIAKVVDGVMTTYLYDTRYRIIEERAGDGSLVARYTYGAGIDEALIMERDGSTYFYHRDALGSVAEVTNEAGALVERYEYDVYGEPRVFDGTRNPLPVSAIDNPYLFTGRWYDLESNNYHYRARDLFPIVGRFLTVDPIGPWEDNTSRGNQYVYTGNNPTNRVDPLGEITIPSPSELSHVDLALVFYFYLRTLCLTPLSSYRDLPPLPGVGALDMSSVFDLYRRDDDVQRQIAWIHRRVQFETKRAAQSNQATERKCYEQRQSGTASGIYITTIYSFGEGALQWAYNCLICSQCNRADAECILHFSASDLFTDPVDLMQEHSWPISVANLGGTPFSFRLAWSETYNYTYPE
jgi:RHS repeat-associated protein